MIYIHNDSHDPFFNHAIEEYFLVNSTEEIFILWQNRPSILIGRNQNTVAEIDQAFVKEHKIDVVRRLSGGGTVFCDLGNFNFTFITNKGSENEDFKTFAKPVIEALHSLNVDAKFSGRNDILIDGKKISGNAQYHHNKRLLHHGTLLFNGNLKELQGALISRPIKFKDKSVKSVSSRVTNIYPYLKEPMSVSEFKDYLSTYIMKLYNIENIYHPSNDELDAIEQIKTSRFMSYEWNYGKSPAYSYYHEEKYPFGLVEVHLNVRKGIIKDIKLHGDFFGEKDISQLENLLITCQYEEDFIKQRLSGLTLGHYIKGMTVDQLIKHLTHT